MSIGFQTRTGAAVIAAAMLNSMLFAVVPSLREQVDLAGGWSGATLPLYSARNTGSTTYQRSISIPAGWTGKKIFLEIEAANHSDVASIDGAQVGSNTGGWFPHSYDITSKVTPGQTHSLQIVVNGAGVNNWPMGMNSTSGGGIVQDIYLRAYGMVAIRDAEVITSVANKTITVNYDVQNFNSTAKTVTVNADIVPATAGAVALTLATASTSFAAGERKIIQASSPWTNPNLWWPADPKLYHLCSAIKESGTTIDSQTVRFGFREMKISGRFLQLNGIRVNGRGESVSSPMSGTDAMRARIELEKSVNGNSTRFHVSPPPDKILDVCDEMGIMVENETPLWQSGVTGTSETRRWVGNWVRHTRNHASILTWSSNNECYGSGGNVKILTDTIKANDGSRRPVWSEDVDFSESETMCKHYPEGYQNIPNTGNMYSTSWISQTKPQSTGEQVACCWSGTVQQPDVCFWQGMYARAERYNNVSIIHNYNYSGWSANQPAAKEVLRLSYAPVALFDYAYDGLGIAPAKDNAYPSVAAGSTSSRTLSLYNDEFSNEIVTVLVEIKSGTTTHATGTKTYQVALGNHISIPCSFQVPYVGGSTFDMVLTTSKAGAVKFTEAKKFTVTGANTGTSTNTVTLGGNAVALLNKAARPPTRSIALIFGKSTLVIPIDYAGKAEKATVSIFTMQGNRLYRASAYQENGGAMAVRFNGQMPAGNYVVKISAAGLESSGRFCLAR